MSRKKLGKYEIVDRIGRGGMAEVYRGYHPALDRYVAIKLLHPFLADDPEFKDRFENEARNVAKLKHPNIVQVYDFEYDAEGESYYMVMELINGPTLKDRIFDLSMNGEQLTTSEVIRIVNSAAEALAYAHQRNMIHRDVKPANLMLDEDGRVVLTDFGIAKIVTSVQFTASGGMVGTPAYMAPEQGLGEAGDERSDIYSLGVILFQLLTGQLPYDAETPLAIILKHLNDPIPSARELDPTIPEALEQIINKAMAKEPQDRYQTAVEFLQDLQQIDETGNRRVQHDTPPRPSVDALPPEPVLVAPPPAPSPTVIETPATARPQPAAEARPATTGRLTWVLGLITGLAVLAAVALLGLGRDNLPLSGLVGSGQSEELDTTGTAVAQVTETPSVTPSEIPTDIPIRQTATSAEAPATAVQVVPPVASRTPKPSPTLTPTPSPLPSETTLPSPTPTATPLPTDTPQPTLTPSPDLTGTAVYAFFLTQAAASPTPNMTQTLAACEFEYIVVKPERYLQPPALNDATNPRLIQFSRDFTLEIVLRNTGTCPWPAGTRLTYNPDLTLDPGDAVNLGPLKDVCPNDLRPGLNFAAQEQSIFLLNSEVGIGQDSAPILFTGTAPDTFGCYYGVWDLFYPGSTLRIGRPLLLVIRVWGSSS